MTDHVPGRRAFRVPSTRANVQREVDDEMEFHIATRVEELVRLGRSPDDARRIAIGEFGDVRAARDELTSIDRRRLGKSAAREWIASWGQDVRFAARSLRTRPAFTATVLLTLALGIGANAAIFSAVDSVLLRPLPFAQPGRLVHLWETFESKVDRRSEASYPDYLDWRARNHSFSDLAGYWGSGFLFGVTQPTLVVGGSTTANFFDVLGVRPILGRGFAPGEDEPGAPRVALVTYGFWLRQLAADTAAVGRPITLNGSPTTVIGVLPSSFRFDRLGNAELWTPIDVSRDFKSHRDNHWLNVVGRLKDGVTQSEAAHDISTIMGALARDYPESNAGRDGQVVPLQKEFVGSIEPVLLLLYGAVVLVLMIACVNVANLLLIRGTDRNREMALRAALGAARGRLVRQLLTESLMLGVLGGVLGLGVAALGLRWLTGAIPTALERQMAMLKHVSLDPRIVAYGLVLSIATSIAFGIVPALRMTWNSYETLRSGDRGSTRSAGRLRDALVVGELALTVVLLSGMMLFGRSLIRLLNINPGFRADHLVTATVVLSPRAPPVATFSRLTARLQALPEVKAVGLVSRLPLSFGGSAGFDIIGQPTPQPGREPLATFRQADPGYFSAAGIPVLRGRAFTSGDQQGAPMAVVVNQALVKAYFPGVYPIGQRLYAFRDTLYIVGVVGDVSIGNIDERIPPTMYASFAQVPQSFMGVVIRTSQAPSGVARELRGVLAPIDPAASMTNAAAMTDVIGDSQSVFLRRYPLYLVGAFAFTALVLAIVGIYGVVSYSVSQRTREMGIRTALGASARSLAGLAMRHGLRMAISGIVIGLVGAIAAGRLVASMLYGVAPTDVVAYGVAALALGTFALCATVLPARRAARVDPAVALRGD
jgi:predicted permease